VQAGRDGPFVSTEALDDAHLFSAYTIKNRKQKEDPENTEHNPSETFDFELWESEF
jgi:hypothetical protein